MILKGKTGNKTRPDPEPQRSLCPNQTCECFISVLQTTMLAPPPSCCLLANPDGQEMVLHAYNTTTPIWAHKHTHTFTHTHTQTHRHVHSHTRTHTLTHTHDCIKIIICQIVIAPCHITSQTLFFLVIPGADRSRYQHGEP